ncbi:MAG: outer membrane lipoprotein carrier protein LolA, partial [Geminicoccaceae bacterium]
LDGDRLHVVVDGNEQVLALDQEPLLRAMVAPFQAVFAGDLGALDHEFDVTSAEQGGRWTVTLTPKAAASSSRFLDRILMTGTGDNVEQVDTYEHDGDRTSMRLDERAEASSVKP